MDVFSLKRTEKLAKTASNSLARVSFETDKLQKKVEYSLLYYMNSGYFKAFFITLFFGMSVLFYHVREGWDVADCVLFVIITITTVGYGTIHPTSEDSRVFTIFLMITGVVAVFSTMSSFLNAGVKRLNIYLAKSVTKRLKKTELLFQQRLYFSILWIVLCAFIGAVILQHSEGWSFITSLYFIVETITVRVRNFIDILLVNITTCVQADIYWASYNNITDCRLRRL